MAKTHVIDGKTYVEVKRNAEVGEKIIIVAAEDACGMYNNGKVLTVDDVTYGGAEVRKVATNGNNNGYICHREYRVLEPLEEPTVDTTQASPQVIDMLANLARRVTQLESQLRATQRNVETFAEQAENNSEDIRTLDERTQVINAITKFYKEANR